MVDITYQVDPDGRFKGAISAALGAVNDLTVPFNLIAKNWYQSNNAIFDLKGPGKYPPLGGMTPNKVYSGTQTNRERAETAKEKKYGFAYPLLKATGALESSLVNANDANAVNLIVNGKMLLLGTNVSYGIFHQSDQPRTKLPFRPFMFLGAEQTSPDGLKNRQNAWIDIVLGYVNQVVSQQLGS